MKKTIAIIFLSCTLASLVTAQQMPALIPYFDNGKWGYCDSNGKVMIQPQWEHQVSFFSNGQANIYAENANCIIDTQGHYIIPPYRHWNGHFYPSVVGALYNATGKDGKYGIIDANNHEMLACLYDRTEFGNGFTSSGYFIWDARRGKHIAKVKKNGKFGIIDTLGNVLIPFQYDGIDIDGGYPFTSLKYYVMQKEGNTGVIDHYNRTIVPAIYRNVWLDELNDNQIMVFKERTTAIADTTGKIILEVPGYTLGFPRDSLFSVQDSNGKYGIMNYQRKLVIPCQYISAWIQHDTIITSKWLPDPTYGQVQGFKCYDARTKKAITGWVTSLTPAQPAKAAIEPAAVKPPPAQKYPPHSMAMHVLGKDVMEYEKEGIVWWATDYGRLPYRFTPVRGMALADTVARYAAVLDSNGNYVVQPVKTNNNLSILNPSDSLILLHSTSNGSN